MEDGSFTDSEGNEFTFSENAVIGLVHPLELSEEEKNAWTEQLSDFEITQPFPQLARQTFSPEEKEKNSLFIGRFNDASVNSLTLMNKMQKLGWYKGQPEDAGWFYYFYREDITSRRIAPDGTLISEGNAAMLTFSGTCVTIYDIDGEDTEIGDLIFYKPGNSPDYYSPKDDKCIAAGKVDPRYFSEIMLQLTSFIE